VTRNGFTLVELLIALLIFGLLSASGVALLSFSVEARVRSGERLDALSSALRTRAMLTADLAQAAPRTYRRDDGSMTAAFRGEEADALLAFVRRGWANEDGAPRASLQRVEYRLNDGRLERLAYPMVDGARPGPEGVLLTGVESLRLRYRYRGAWSDDWAAPR
jgi:general secretion pathway protein J